MYKAISISLMVILSVLFMACNQSASPEPTAATQAQGAAPPAKEAAPPVLPNLLVQAEGQVWLRRAGWADFLPAGFGVAVGPGDLLRVTEEGSAAVFCGDQSTWEEGPVSLAADGMEHGVPCQAGRPPRPWTDVAALRGEKDGQVPYVLRPRNTALLDARPSLKWHSLPDVEAYTISLLSDDGQDRAPVQATGAELGWPDEWPPLEPNATYVLVVEGDGRRSDENNASNAGLGFWLLPAEEAEAVQTLEARLRAQPVSPIAADVLVAELYLSRGLRAEAAQLLAARVASEGSPAIWQTLGQVHLETGLAEEAWGAFEQALAGARADGELEAEAEAQVGLGLAARLANDPEAAREHLQAARTLYEQIGHQDGLDQVDDLLAE